jgi:hypothetical protein
MKYYKYLLIFCILVISHYYSLSQVTFFRNIDFGGDDAAFSIKPTSDNGYILTGSSNDHLLVIKLDYWGDTTWTRIFNIKDGSVGTDICQTNYGDYGVTGGLGNGANMVDLFVARLHSDGDTVWIRSFGGVEWDRGEAICPTQDGGFIVTGQTQSIGDGSEIITIKLDSNGIVQWNYSLINNGLGWGASIINTNDSNFLIDGNNGGYPWLIKLNTDGDTIWTKTIHCNHSTTPYGSNCIIRTSDDGYVFTGCHTAKVNAQGILLWEKNYNGIEIIENNSRELVLCSSNYDLTYGNSLNIMKMNDNGDSLWSKTFGMGKDAIGYSIAKAHDGGTILCGRMDPDGDGLYDVMILKTDENGWAGTDNSERASEAQLVISPNPFSDHATISISNKIVFPSKFVVYNILGEQVLSIEINSGNTALQRGNLPSGVYLYRLQSPDFTVCNGKFIIN